MSNQIVSIRIPKSLTKKLKDYAFKKHFMDVSEVVRTLLRNRWMEYRDPYTSQVKGLRNDLKSRIIKSTDKNNYSNILKELDMIKKEILKKSGEQQ